MRGLISIRIPVVGLVGMSQIIIGSLDLTVAMLPYYLGTSFQVVNMPSPYNSILGRGWLQQLRVVALTLHQIQRYPSSEGMMVINEN